MKRSHGVNVRNLIQKIENHPQRQALQSDLQQHRQFNPFSKESQDVIKAAGTLNCVNYSMLNPKHSAKYVCRTGTSASSTTCGHFLRDDMTENKKLFKSVLDLFSIPNYYIRKGRPHGHRYGNKKKGIKNITLRISSRRNARKENSGAFTIGSSVMHDSERP